MQKRPILYALALIFALAGCKRHAASSAPGSAAPTGASAPALQPIGMTDPFSGPKGDFAKLWESGYTELRNKRPQPAAAALQNVVDATPDFTAARYVLIRALAALHRFDEIPAHFEQLVARDWVGYAHKLDKPKEFAALRASPAWAKITALATRYQAPYAKGLDKGLFFVVRMHSASEPTFAPGTTDAPLSLKQEVFHYDPGTKRFRRITDTNGRAFAIDVTPDGKSLYFLVAPKLHRENGVDSFVDPRLGVVDLATLDTIGPFTEKGRYDQVGLGRNRLGQPMFTFVVTSGATEAYTIDTARTGLAPLSGDAVIPDGGETRAWAHPVAHFEDKAVPGVKIDDGATQFLVAGVGTPVIAARPIAQSSLEWSPSKSRLTYAGKLDACKILKGES
jgi:hypothetical protein